MTNIVSTKMGTFIAGMSILAMLAVAIFGLPQMAAPKDASAATLLKFKNLYGARVSRPDVSGEWMVYVDYRDNGIAALYTYNFKTNEEKMISWNQPKLDESVVTPKINEGFVAYTNKLNDGMYTMNFMNQYMYTTHQVAQSKWQMSAPSFDAMNIVWTQGDPELPKATQVYWYDADRSALEQLTTSDTIKKSAVVRGNTAYWLESVDGDLWDIVKHELDFNMSKTVATKLALTGSISTSGELVAYALVKEGQSDIYTMNAITGEITQVTKTGVNEYDPVIRGVNIAYFENVYNKEPEIAIYDRVAGTRTVLTNDDLTPSALSLSPARLAWSDTRTGVEQIYLYDFDSTDEKFSNDLRTDMVVRIAPQDPTPPQASVPYTAPADMDTDGDGITDIKEKTHYKTSVTRADTDGDGLADNEELFVYKTDPLKFDSDEDGFGDGTEVKTAHDPLSKPTAQKRYGISRFALPVEQAMAKQLYAQLQVKMQKKKLGIGKKNWPFYVNAYIYGGYSIDEIVKSARGKFGVISADVPASEWRTREMYKKAMGQL